MAHNIKQKYKNRNIEFQEGDISRSEFIKYYDGLRAIAQRRMDALNKYGLKSTVLEQLESYVYQASHFLVTQIPSATNIDNPLKAYQYMYDFVSSPYSTVKGWMKMEEEITKQLGEMKEWRNPPNIPFDSSSVKHDYWLNLFMRGHFWRLKKIYGTSPDAFKELESLIDEGLTTNDIIDALNLSEIHGADFDEVIQVMLDQKQMTNEYSLKEFLRWKR